MTTTAFVLSGGGSLGAVQVGMLQALAGWKVRPDLLVGTSAGALNAAYVAGHGMSRESLDGLVSSWTSVHRRDIFPLHPARVMRSLSGGGGALCANTGLRRIVLSHLTFDLLEDAPTPVSVVATDLLCGLEVLLSTGDAVSAVLASAAVPGILPAVQRDGRTLVDGGLADNTAISQAVALGADRVVVLPSGYACALPAPPRSPLGAAMQALSLLTQQRLIADIAAYADRVEMVVLPPPCPLSVSPMDFGQAASLVRQARETAREWMESGGLGRTPSADEIGLHRHGVAVDH
jgi:NTE family protein